MHLTAARLMEAATRARLRIVGASCHDARELARARDARADFVVLGPVRRRPATGRAAAGLAGFFRLIRDYPLPVYALGGLRADPRRGVAAGAHGISLMRGAWSGAQYR